MGFKKDGEAISFLDNYLDLDGLEGWAVFHAIGFIGGEEAIEILETQIKKSGAKNKALAAEALSLCGDENSAKLLNSLSIIENDKVLASFFIEKAEDIMRRIKKIN